MEPNSEIKSNTPQERAQALLRFFLGRQDAYALQQKDGQYFCIRKPLKLQVIDAHCKGQHTVGVYLLTTDGRAKFGVVDLDEDTGRARAVALCLKRALAHFNIPSHLEPSGRKGYHLWVPFASFLPASKVRRLLLGLLVSIPDEYQGMKLEVFPKQATPADLGNLIKLPWGRHQVTGRWTYFVDEAFQPLPDGGLPALLAAKLATEEDVGHAIAELPEPSTLERGREPFRLPETLAVGGRYPNLFKFACSLRSKGFGETEILVALQVANQRCQSQKREKELEGIARSVCRRYPAGSPPGNGAQKSPVLKPRAHRSIPTFAVED